jgi:hypothetical protein
MTRETPMKILLAAMAAIEAMTGAALLLWPRLVVGVLLAAPVEDATALTLGRLAGAAVMSLGVACWLARGGVSSSGVRGIVGAMLVYNAAAAGVLAYAQVGLGLGTRLSWPVAVLHGAFAIWCAASLARGRATDLAARLKTAGRMTCCCNHPPRLGSTPDSARGRLA